MVRPFHWLWFPTVIPVSKDPASLSLGEPASNPLSSPSIRRSPHRDSNRDGRARGRWIEKGPSAHFRFVLGICQPTLQNPHSGSTVQSTAGSSPAHSWHPLPGPRPAPLPCESHVKDFQFRPYFSSLATRGRNFCCNFRNRRALRGRRPFAGPTRGGACPRFSASCAFRKEIKAVEGGRPWDFGHEPDASTVVLGYFCMRVLWPHLVLVEDRPVITPYAVNISKET